MITAVYTDFAWHSMGTAFGSDALPTLVLSINKSPSTSPKVLMKIPEHVTNINERMQRRDTSVSPAEKAEALAWMRFTSCTLGDTLKSHANLPGLPEKETMERAIAETKTAAARLQWLFQHAMNVNPGLMTSLPPRISVEWRLKQDPRWGPRYGVLSWEPDAWPQLNLTIHPTKENIWQVKSVEYVESSKEALGKHNILKDAEGSVCLSVFFRGAQTVADYHKQCEKILTAQISSDNNTMVMSATDDGSVPALADVRSWLQTLRLDQSFAGVMINAKFDRPSEVRAVGPVSV